MMREPIACPKAFVLGHPIKHSKSPLLHRAAYQQLNEHITYERRDTTEEQVAAVFAELGPDVGTCGFSVTMPLKTVIMQHLDELTLFAQAVGVVNTVFWRKDAEGNERAYGHNTDVSGIVNALRQAGVEGAPRSAAIIGGGGTATAALAALAYLGTGNVLIFVRDPARALGVSEAAARLGLNITFADIASFSQLYQSFDVTISTLPAGAADALLVGAPPHLAKVLLDVSYDPWPSPLASAWQERGGAVTSGLEMLMYQAVDQVKLFTGRTLEERLPNQAEVLAAMRQAIGLAVTGFDPELVSDPAKLTR